MIDEQIAHALWGLALCVTLLIMIGVILWVPEDKP